jgi:hypothetical protein
MIATLREIKAKLSRMVTLAANGEEILITVPAKCRRADSTSRSPATIANGRVSWRIAAQIQHGQSGRTAEEIISEGRDERV